MSILGQIIHVIESEMWRKNTEIFPFSHDIHFKAELYHHIYCYLWKTSVRIILDCINIYLDPQWIVSQEVFQLKILNWSALLPLLSLHTSRAGKRGQELWELLRSTCLEVLIKKYLFWKAWKIFTKTLVVGSGFDTIARPVTVLK